MKKPKVNKSKIGSKAVVKDPAQSGPPFNAKGFNSEVNYALDSLARQHPKVQQMHEKVKGRMAAHFRKMGFGASDTGGGE